MIGVPGKVTACTTFGAQALCRDRVNAISRDGRSVHNTLWFGMLSWSSREIVFLSLLFWWISQMHSVHSTLWMLGSRNGSVHNTLRLLGSRDGGSRMPLPLRTGCKNRGSCVLGCHSREKLKLLSTKSKLVVIKLRCAKRGMVSQRRGQRAAGFSMLADYLRLLGGRLL